MAMKEWQCSGMQFTKWFYISCVWRCFIGFSISKFYKDILASTYSILYKRQFTKFYKVIRYYFFIYHGNHWLVFIGKFDKYI